MGFGPACEFVSQLLLISFGLGFHVGQLWILILYLNTYCKEKKYYKGYWHKGNT